MPKNSPNKTFEKAQKIIELLNEGITKEEFLRSFKNILEIIKRREKSLNDSNASGLAAIQAAFESLGKSTAADFEAAKGDLLAKVTAALQDQQRGMNFIYDKVRGLKGGKPGPKGDPGESIKGDPGSPDTAEQVRDKLETLEGAERLCMSAIDGLEEALLESKKTGEPVRLVPGGPRGMFIYVGGVKKGIISNINFVPGTGMSIAFSTVNGQATLTFNSTGAGVNVETPTGTVNGTNAVFKPTAQPKWVVADGTTYYQGAGYAWDGTNITMDIPPSGFIRDIY